MPECLPPEEKRTAIIDYLQTNVTQGKQYYKAKRIANELGLSSREVGSNLRKLADDHTGRINIEPYSETRATTWKVTTSDQLHTATPASDD